MFSVWGLGFLVKASLVQGVEASPSACSAPSCDEDEEDIL